MNIKLINGQYAAINMETVGVRAHFVDPFNYTDVILDQFENSIYKDYITPGDGAILDIGANVGLFALHVSPYAKKIVCVEPTPEHMQKQKEILKDLPLTVVVHEQSALSDHIGEQDFHWCGINTTMNSLQNRFDRKFTVATVTLEDLVKRHKLYPVDFCKIDIEGSEWQAITETTLAPAYKHVEKIWIELHPPTPDSQDHFSKIFENVGYKVKKVIHDTLYCYR